MSAANVEVDVLFAEVYERLKAMASRGLAANSPASDASQARGDGLFP